MLNFDEKYFKKFQKYLQSNFQIIIDLNWFFNKRDNEHFINEAFKIVQYGWKKTQFPLYMKKSQ